MKKLILIFIIFFLGCSDEEKKPKSNTTGIISEISEASGICYVDKTDTLFVVGDDGKIYEIDTKGDIKRERSFNHLNDNDFEGIAYLKSEDLLLVAVEGVDNILILDRNTLNIKKEVSIKRGDILSKDKENGLEGIAILDENIYLSNQSSVFIPNLDPSLVIQIDGIEGNKAEIIDTYDHGYKDIAGLAFKNGFLYMLSDSSNQIIKYDLKGSKTVQFSELLKGSWEGIAFDNNGYIYLADDSKGKIFKYKKSKFNL